MRNAKKLLIGIAAAAALAVSPLPASAASRNGGSFTVGDKTFLLNGKPFVVKAAELHYPRIPKQYWEHRIKMCKSLGMNTVCLYVFWNIHEPQENQFDFTGQNDVAEFCRLAQKHGMYVIVRPGPYVCAEWEMGGLPWWLLKKKDIRLREQDPYFMERVELFEKKVAEQLSSLTIQNGGPIIMVQVENEYGSYGTSKEYVGQIRDFLRKYWKPASGKSTTEKEENQLTLFQCDWNSNFEKNALPDLVWTMNFGTGADIDKQFSRLREIRPNTPLMCSEFWSGWFDKWGARHETRPAKDMVDGIDEMLSKGISFSLYMTHGGTSFGHWAGANSPGFAPDVTSYDYDAPINEYGQPTEKFWLLRKTLQKYSDTKLPQVPKSPLPTVEVDKFAMTEYAPLNNGISKTVSGRDLKTFEEMDMGWGSAVYETTLPAIDTQSLLVVRDVHDFAQVFVDGKYVGKIDRVKNEKAVSLPAVKRGARLSILVEAMGRINFGRAIKDFKGITDKVSIETECDGHSVTYDLHNWNISLIPDDYATAQKALAKASAKSTGNGGAGYYRGTFKLKKIGDTFLNFETWGKGQVYVNGHPLGRIWSIGPQQTLYCPGVWLKKGVNEVVVLDVVGPKQAVVWGQNKPELNKLQLEKSNKHNNIGDKPDLNSATPVLTGAMASGNGWQTLKFKTPAKGRYLALQCLDVHGTEPLAIAELYLNDTQGRRISREQWSVKYADSENENGNHTGDKAFDLQESTYWQTEKNSDFPHLIVIDLGAEYTVGAIEYLPRMEQGAPGSLKNFKAFLY